MLRDMRPPVAVCFVHVQSILGTLAVLGDNFQWEGFCDVKCILYM